jgi:hypothetical protein
MGVGAIIRTTAIATTISVSIATTISVSIIGTVTGIPVTGTRLSHRNIANIITAIPPHSHPPDLIHFPPQLPLPPVLLSPYG